MRRGKVHLERGTTHSADLTHPEQGRERERTLRCSWRRRKKDRKTEELIVSEVRGLIILNQQWSLGRTDISRPEVDVKTEIGEKTEGIFVWVQGENGVRGRGRETSTGIVVLTGEIEGGGTTTPRGCLSHSLIQRKFQDWEISLRYVVNIRMDGIHLLPAIIPNKAHPWDGHYTVAFISQRDE